MGNVQSKGTSRFDDDADFAASFVLSRAEVDDALASAAAEPSSDVAGSSRPVFRRMSLLYAGVGAVIVLLVAALTLLAFG